MGRIVISSILWQPIILVYMKDNEYTHKIKIVGNVVKGSIIKC